MARFSAEAGRAFIARAFCAVGMPEDDAASVAELMIAADLRGADGHGIFRLPQYVRRIKAGGVNVRPNIRTIMEADATALIDGDNGMGHLVMRRAAELAIAKAKKCGIGWVGARASNHAGPAALYAMMPLEHDMIGQYLAVANANHMAPWGGIELLLGTNPIATAIPGREEPPIVLDLATTVVSYGTVKVKALNGERLGDGWMIDREGQPLTDAKRSAEGSLLPIGGYKGYGLALVFGLLAGTLNGAAMARDVVDFNADDKTPTNTGQAIMALDIARFGPVEEFKRNVDAVIREMRHSERLPGVDAIRVPGEQSHRQKTERSAHGIPIRPALLGNLEKLAVELGIGRLDIK
jgi:LDH2 family malate/lactate/ureidoglycolate dehydrogenase